MAFTILPPSFGRRWRGAPEVGFRSGVKKNVRCASPVSSSRAQPRDLFRSPLPSQSLLTANEKDFSLALEMTIRGKGFAIGKAAFSFLRKEVPRRGGGWLTLWDAVFSYRACSQTRSEQ